MYKLVLILSCFSVGLSSVSYAQLSGYFTVGKSNSDYKSLAWAIDDLQNQGIDSVVILAMEPDDYSGVFIGEIPGTSSENRVIIESKNHDSTEVVFDGVVSLNQSDFVTFQYVSFESNVQPTINILQSKNFIIKNSLISCSSSGNSSSDGAIYTHNGSISNGNIEIYNCHIFTNDIALNFTHLSGESIINNCSIISETDKAVVVKWVEDLVLKHNYIKANDKYAIETNWLNTANVDSNYFDGAISFDVDNYSKFRNNTIIGDANLGYFPSIINNQFYSQNISIRSNYFENNQFIGGYLIISSENSQLYNNFFDVEVRISRAHNSVIRGNIIKKYTHLSFNKALRLENNYIYGDFYYGDVSTYNSQYWVQNNVFSNCNLNARGHHSKIRYNTFIDSAYLYAYYSDILVNDNLFCTAVDGWYANSNISNNNYYPATYVSNDSLATNYNPMYNVSGVPTNPLLQGKGKSDAPEFDINGNKRQNPAAIGAHEVFICSGTSDEISIKCGDDLYLNMCSVPDTGFFWWSPAEYVDNPDSLYTKVTTYENVTLYLNHSIEGIIDSISITTENFIVNIPDVPVVFCNFPRVLAASYHPKATYHWTPEEGLDFPNSRMPVLNISDTSNLTFIVECYIEGCGISYDTVKLDYNFIPWGSYFQPFQIEDTVFFSSEPHCATEVIWEFGDGDTAHGVNAYHIYKENGSYTITLRFINDFGENFGLINYYFQYYQDDIWEFDDEFLKVFPNPTKDILYISGLGNKETTIDLFSVSGDLLSSEISNTDRFELDVSNIETGIYLVRFSNQQLSVIKKVIVR